MSTCPHIITAHEGTSHCRLAERDGQNIADLRAQLGAKDAEISSLRAENAALKKRDDILTAAMAEVKATDDGKSTQPINRIVQECIAELNKYSP